MRRILLAGIAGATVFAVSSAAASSIDVTGPFNPRAGTGQARTCDLGVLTVTAVLSGVSPLTTVNNLTLMTTQAPVTGDACPTAMVWIRVENAVPAIGGSVYMKVPADDFTETAAEFGFSGSPAHPIYSDLDMASNHRVTEEPLTSVFYPGTVHWLISETTPSSL